ncbi:MAG: hypothetical protein IJ622_08050 [Bacteroidales bacterium]|nr:hypothetical protein [Bacteroidales bacterium]
MKKVINVMFVALISCFLFTSCGAIKPRSFVQATDGGSWSSIMIREDLSYDQAFNEVIDVVARRFEMDMISKDGGYGRTNWCYTWNDNGKYTEKYRTRVIFKFSNDRKKVDIKTEAEFGGGTSWIRGFDTRLLSTIKQDISGAVGRTVM